jgi:dihydroorotase
MVSSGTTSVSGFYVSESGSVEHGMIDIVGGFIRSVSGYSGPAEHDFGEEFLLWPGFIDMHVHAREYPLPQSPSDIDLRAHASQVAKEDYGTVCAAAANGGVVAFADMPNNPFPPKDGASYLAKRVLAARRCTVDSLLYALIVPGSEPFSACVPYKIYTHDFSEQQLEETLSAYRGQFVAAHCENRDVVAQYPHRPCGAEVKDIGKMLDLASGHGFSLHISHVSTYQGLELIVAAKRAGLSVTCETTPTYLFFSKENLRGSVNPGWLTMKPPIRTEKDRLAMLEGVMDGSIDVIATDHAPHTRGDKDAGVFGIPLLDHYTNFVGWLLQEGVSMKRVLELCCVNPGNFMTRFTGLEFGRIAPGNMASFTVTERLPPVKLDSRSAPISIMSKAGWSPFDGCTLGKDYLLSAKETFVRGIPMKRSLDDYRAK